MCTAGFPEPMTFSLRAARQLLPRAGEFDVVHDNQSPGLRAAAAGRAPGCRPSRPCTTRSPSTGGSSWPRRPALRRRLTLRRWYGFTGMQARVARRLDAVTTVSENSRRDIATHMGLAADGHRGHPGRHRPRRVHARRRPASRATPTRSW